PTKLPSTTKIGARVDQNSSLPQSRVNVALLTWRVRPVRAEVITERPQHPRPARRKPSHSGMCAGSTASTCIHRVIHPCGFYVLVHGLRAFDKVPFLNSQWEKRQVERYLGGICDLCSG